jgi:putative aldouronate transport system permease protein
MRDGSKGLFNTIYKQWQLLLMLLPTITIITIFTYKPITGWVIAFKDYRPGFPLWQGDWIGFESFKEFFSDTNEAYDVIRNTIIMNIGSIIAVLFLGLVFSILLNEIKFKSLKNTIQIISLFPFFISWVITYSILTAMLSANSGLINMLLVKYNFVAEGINVLGDPRYSWALVIAVNIWKGLGYVAVIFLSTIVSIDQQQYESADIDGAGRWDKIRHITIPNLMPTMMILLILNSGMILNSSFEQYFLLINPTNVSTMEVFDTFIYNYGMKLGDFSYASAVSIIKTVFSISILIAVNSLFKKTYNRSLF